MAGALPTPTEPSRIRSLELFIGKERGRSWIAEWLGMGNRGYLNHLLCRPQRSRRNEPLLGLPDWSPVGTNTLLDGWSHFSDPEWTNYANRFYRLRSP